MIIGIDGNEANLENRVGVNQYAAQVLIALEKLQESKKHSFIIYLKGSPLPHLPKERRGWKYKILQGRGVWILIKLMPYLWSNPDKIDLLFTPSHYTPLLTRISTVVSIMDIGYLKSKEQFRKYDFYQLKYWGMLSMFFAKKIIAISESTKKQIIEFYPWAKKKVEVILPGYDKENFHFPLSDLQINKVKKKYGITSEYILFLSTLKPSKNIEGLLEAFKLFNGDLKLVIAGKKGWLYESIFKKVQELNLEERVIFTDFVPEEDKPSLLAGAKVFVSPSFWEGFGMHVLEAMAVGTPVVVSNTGSLPEVVGTAGICVDSSSPGKIAKGIEKALMEHGGLSKKCWARAQEFSWSKAASDTLRIFEEVAERGREVVE